MRSLKSFTLNVKLVLLNYHFSCYILSSNVNPIELAGRYGLTYVLCHQTYKITVYLYSLGNFKLKQYTVINEVL